MDEIGQRLRESADACVAAYEAWAAAKKDVEIRERLQEAVHELRKVSARLEIEMAVSEREQMSQRPIPVPPHRSAKRRDPSGNGDDVSDLPGFITDGGDDMGEGQGSSHQGMSQGQGGRSQRSGGGRSSGGARRPARRPQGEGE